LFYRSLLPILLCCWSALAFADYAATPKRPVDVAGFWELDAAASDDPEAMLAERQRKEREEFERMRRREEQSRPSAMPPPIDADAPPPDPSRRRMRPWQKQREEHFRRMLMVSPTLEIKQLDVTRFDVISAVESRRVEAGSHTQVSMPEGQLADSQVGWDGEWFVIERRVRSGPRALEKFRIVKKTGQLEYFMAWSGDSELAGMKVRRFFNKRQSPPPAPDPSSGPQL